MHTAYCLRCREKVTLKGEIHEKKLPNGSIQLKGTCPKCNKSASTIMSGNKKKGGESPLNVLSVGGGEYSGSGTGLNVYTAGAKRRSRKSAKSAKSAVKSASKSGRKSARKSGSKRRSRRSKRGGC